MKGSLEIELEIKVLEWSLGQRAVICAPQALNLICLGYLDRPALFSWFERVLSSGERFNHLYNNCSLHRIPLPFAPACLSTPLNPPLPSMTARHRPRWPHDSDTAPPCPGRADPPDPVPAKAPPAVPCHMLSLLHADGIYAG